MSSRANNLFPLSLPAVGIFIALFGLSLEAQPDRGLIPTTASFQHRSENGNSVKNYQPRFAKGHWIKVGGFADSKYFYGYLQLLEKRKVAGYLYVSTPPPKRVPIDPSTPDFPRQKQDQIRQEQIYVYGEVVRPGEFRVFDQQGTVYRLLVVGSDR